jgi:hypothetical protein
MGVIRQQRSRFLDYLLPGHAATVLCWQVIEIAANATALRAHHKLTFSVEKARASHGLVGHKQRLWQTDSTGRGIVSLCLSPGKPPRYDQLVDGKASYAARRRAIFPSGFENWIDNARHAGHGHLSHLANCEAPQWHGRTAERKRPSLFKHDPMDQGGGCTVLLENAATKSQRIG